jgi:hypothetical protein
MTRDGRIATLATLIASLAALAISIYPGVLNDLLSLVVVLVVLGSPILLLIFVVLLYLQYRRGTQSEVPFPWKYSTIALLILSMTYVALHYYLPRRVAFAACRTTFQRLIDEGVVDSPEFNRLIGPYYIDECRVDERGGTYFRVYSGGDGLGPDVMSYGFCYRPNDEGSPFGAAHYRTFRMGKDWYWFRVSDDWH